MNIHVLFVRFVNLSYRFGVLTFAIFEYAELPLALNARTR